MASRKCKYGCGTEIEWDSKVSKFRESKTAELHTPERCKSIKGNKSSIGAAYIKSDDYTLIKQIEEFDSRIRNIEETSMRIEELLEATLKNLGLFKTADGEKVD